MAPAHRWRLFVLPAVLVPIAVALRLGGIPDLAVFAAAGLAVVPLAHLMGLATEELSKRAGPGIGGLPNATMGNATELIIALVALARAGAETSAGDPAAAGGLAEVGEGAVTGSTIGQLLPVPRLGILVAG